MCSKIYNFNIKMEKSKSQVLKILRKQKRCQSIIFKETGLQSSDLPTENIAICNAGLSTGLKEENLLKEVSQYGKINKLIMLPNKSYCFIKCTDIESSQSIFSGMHGISKLGQSGAILYLSYFETLPNVEDSFEYSNPPGLIILTDFVNEEEEKSIISLLNVSSGLENSLKHRYVKHYGYEFLYNSNNVEEDKPISTKIPTEFNILWDRLRKKNKNLEWYEPDQLTVNIYKPGQGIPPHVDTHSAFLDPIMSLSLGDDVIMEFRKFNKCHLVNLPKRSLLIMSGESRYDWTHGIRPRVMDIVQTTNLALTVRHRNQRTSLTFRKLRRGRCFCNYERLCDSKTKSLNNPPISAISGASKLELENVHKVYDEIAPHFSETRHSPWPKVSNFINSFKIGDVLLDIGCGNGKYLNVSSNRIKIGCDRSERLLAECKRNKFNTFRCDCLSIPFRNESVNSCISIAVIHHLATEERRLKAIREMTRILIVNGKGLIYVWAKNQSLNSKKSSYLRQNTNSKEKDNSKENLNQNDNIIKNNLKENHLPIHTNRTEFKEQDVLVPWKLKNTKNNSEDSSRIFLRYYHVFEKDELNNLCKKVENIEIIESYYDEGNWCVIFEKISKDKI